VDASAQFGQVGLWNVHMKRTNRSCLHHTCELCHSERLSESRLLNSSDPTTGVSASSPAPAATSANHRRSLYSSGHTTAEHTDADGETLGSKRCSHCCDP